VDGQRAAGVVLLGRLDLLTAAEHAVLDERAAAVLQRHRAAAVVLARVRGVAGEHAVAERRAAALAVDRAADIHVAVGEREALHDGRGAFAAVKVEGAARAPALEPPRLPR